MLADVMVVMVSAGRLWGWRLGGAAYGVGLAACCEVGLVRVEAQVAEVFAVAAVSVDGGDGAAGQPGASGAGPAA